MCGIAGILNSPHPQVQNLKYALDSIKHRGPEGEGLWANEEKSVMLGHRRLSILDPGEFSAQPMHYMDRYIITYNGEVYNYLELKERLKQRGYSFTTNSDTEVILACFDAFGKACVMEFEGMFAFAIWDKLEQTLYAARDRFGEKPFFYYYDGHQFIFASEIKALWKAGVQKVVNTAMVYNFITVDYSSNPSEPSETFYREIRKLPAASYLSYIPSSQQLAIEKYWQLFPQIKAEITEAEALDQFNSLFSESINHRLRSAVEIGSNLSGGLDSSAIAAYCNGQTQSQYKHKCFTACFTGFDKNEKSYAARVAKQFNLEQYFIEMNGLDIVNLMEKVSYHQDEPISSSSVLAQYRVFEFAHQQGVTVLLDGQGADEILGGYHKYFKWYWQELFRNKILGSSSEYVAAKKLGVSESFSFKNKAAALFPELAMALLQTKKSRLAYNHPDLHKDFTFSHKQSLYYSTPSSFDLNGALYFNTFISGLEDLLRYADRNSMAHSTEVRLPFLDHHLVRFIFDLPSHMKIHGGWTKWLLRKLVEKTLPEDIVWRKDKIGFEPPQKYWMHTKEVQDHIIMGKEKLKGAGILNATAVQKKVKPHNAYAAKSDEWKYWSLSFLF
ncbi:MAG: asparagine synthase (glutamine-hydrolyzing) [Flavisolibacter sp.]